MSRILFDRFLLDEDGLLGPSPRYVIWFHGCNRMCPGCIAVDWNSKNKSEFDISVLTVIHTVMRNASVEGITISGGEPFMQLEALLELTRELHEHSIGIIVYTGYELSELKQMKNSIVDEIISYIDVLVDGRYIAELDDDKAFRGSSNQTIHHFTDRYKNYYTQEKNRISRIEKKDGQGLLTGIPNASTRAIWNKTKESDGYK